MKHLFTVALTLLFALTCISISTAQEFQTKDAWAVKIVVEKRISQALCGDGSYLLICTTEYTDVENGQQVRKTIGQADCHETVDYLTKALLHDGKADGKPAMFYLKLPQNIGAGYQMDYFAGELAKQVFAQINGVLQQKGGSIKRSPDCDQKMMSAFKINGN